MTSPRPETTDRTEQIEDKEKPQGAQLSATQVAAGALAAVSSAVVASFFGLAGTLIGAALASVISTVSAALYSNSLQKTNEKLRRARGQLTARQPAVEEAEVAPAAPATRVLPAHLDPRRAPARRSRPRWTRVAVYAAAVFVMAMGIVTGIELVGQKPVSALVGGTETSRTTTLGEITTASSSSEQQDDDDSTPSSPTTTAPATGTSAPAPDSDTGTDEGSTSEDEGSDSERSSSATPTRSPAADPTTGSERSDSSGGSSQRSSSQDSAEDDSAPAAGAEPTP
ncbi:hypothetical protein [Geodermatophilus poikilotrophus]|uniref:Uncharacterized protein n=1 Tax=Geodermatophilus poikilotrophus TaxID=1333667 RepID=A0A1I0DVI8_9ACTN|nr:hypothetical protein [Geodermatophilus poikilotrophus]SET35836.1 hypothetical protein SAMN04488546_2139 [Geodermatophilus poikilotrophus]